jgi:hypothetical protein
MKRLAILAALLLTGCEAGAGLRIDSRPSPTVSDRPVPREGYRNISLARFFQEASDSAESSRSFRIFEATWRYENVEFQGVVSEVVSHPEFPYLRLVPIWEWRQSEWHKGHDVKITANFLPADWNIDLVVGQQVMIAGEIAVGNLRGETRETASVGFGLVECKVTGK